MDIISIYSTYVTIFKKYLCVSTLYFAFCFPFTVGTLFVCFYSMFDQGHIFPLLEIMVLGAKYGLTWTFNISTLCRRDSVFKIFMYLLI